MMTLLLLWEQYATSMFPVLRCCSLTSAPQHWPEFCHALGSSTGTGQTRRTTVNPDSKHSQGTFKQTISSRQKTELFFWIVYIYRFASLRPRNLRIQVLYKPSYITLYGTDISPCCVQVCNTFYNCMGYCCYVCHRLSMRHASALGYYVRGPVLESGTGTLIYGSASLTYAKFLRWVVIEAFSGFIEVALFTLSIYLVWRLKVPLKSKFLVVGAFLCRPL